jgi:hypothetical protein
LAIGNDVVSRDRPPNTVALILNDDLDVAVLALGRRVRHGFVASDSFDRAGFGERKIACV